MNKQNVILNVVDMLNTYKAIIPKNKLKILESRKWLPLTQNSDLAPKAAFMVGKIMGDGEGAASQRNKQQRAAGHARGAAGADRGE